MDLNSKFRFVYICKRNLLFWRFEIVSWWCQKYWKYEINLPLLLELFDESQHFVSKVSSRRTTTKGTQFGMFIYCSWPKLVPIFNSSSGLRLNRSEIQLAFIEFDCSISLKIL